MPSSGLQHHAPHRLAAFEGYYSKFDLPSGAHLALIVSQVRGVKNRPHKVSFTYVPNDLSKLWQKEVTVKNIEMRKLGPDSTFVLHVPEAGYVKWSGDGTSEYSLDFPEFSFHGTTSTRTPWSQSTSTPESWLVYLPLPLHWHVQSLGSVCDYAMKIPSYEDLPSEDADGTAIVHQEKNWANSFPAAHMWLQARRENSSICVAGGKILGMEAFLLGYRSEKYNLDFRPPFAIRLLGIGPFMSFKSDWESRTFELSVQSFSQKLTIKASAPKGTFFPLSAPFFDGHRPNFLNQSFQASFDVKIYESGWFSPWELVHEDHFEGASLEYGGEYYPHAGAGKENAFH